MPLDSAICAKVAGQRQSAKPAATLNFRFTVGHFIRTDKSVYWKFRRRGGKETGWQQAIHPRLCQAGDSEHVVKLVQRTSE